MRYKVRFKATEEACRLTNAEERAELMNEAISQAERLELGQDEAAIFRVGADLVMVVRWKAMALQLMTCQEAERAHLPKPTDLN